MRRSLNSLLATLLVAVFGSIVLAQPGPPPGPPPKLLKIKDDLYMIENANANLDDLRNYGGNVTVLLTNDGVLLVDCKFERNHDDVVAKVKSLTDKPIKYIINTHNHGDHSGGNAKMQALGASIVISAADRENMLRTNQAGQPQVGYVGRAQVVLGGKEAQLYEFRGHTRGDKVVYFPVARLVAVGDLVTTSDQIPAFVNYADGGNWTDWGKSLDEILKLDFDAVVPGHGPLITKQELVAFRDKTAAIRERVRAMVRDKRTKDEIAQALLAEFKWGQPASNSLDGMMAELR